MAGGQGVPAQQQALKVPEHGVHVGLAAALEPALPAKLGALRSLGADLLTLGRHPLFVLNLAAYCPVQAAFGAFTFWGPKV